jgi:peptidoglycan-associated lipoprotein
MKTQVLVLSVLALAACSSEAKNVKPAAAPVAAPAPAQSAEQAAAPDDGAKLATGPETSRDMFGAPAAHDMVVVHFDYDSALLSEPGQNALRLNAEYLRKNPEAKVVVEGHTDERGSDEYNLALGERRAKAVRDYLTLLGVDAVRLKTVSYGAEQPVDMDHSEEAWSQNRRAQFRELE